MKKYLAEYIGTFALVLIGTGAMVIDQHSGGAVGLVGIALAFGMIVMSMVYVFGPISGAHINPAVTIAFAYRGDFPKKQVGPYIIVQILGAVTASSLLRMMFPLNESLGWTIPSGGLLQSFVNEFVLTFLLMLSILGSTAEQKTESLCGLIIGFTLIGLILFGGPISGGAFNPARTLGPAIITQNFTALWLYMVAPPAGAVSAVVLWRYLKAEGQ